MSGAPGAEIRFSLMVGINGTDEGLSSWREVTSDQVPKQRSVVVEIASRSRKQHHHTPPPPFCPAKGCFTFGR